MFEAFFWIEPQRASPAERFSSTRVVFHYPPDVAHITTPFRDIPQFCFPDLERVVLQTPSESNTEFFTFALTGKDGSRVYGVCMRPYFRGEGLRYDVRRRARHCLCLITRRPVFAPLRAVLLQLHGLTLLDEVRPGSSALAFLKALYNAEAPTMLTVNTEALQRPFLVPMSRRLDAADSAAPLLPLLQALGAHTLFLLLSCVLCEKRVLFIADDADTLSQSVLAAASLVRPFAWPHILIPLLPSSLLDYAAAPVPYLIGVRRYQLPRVEAMGAALSDCVLVDVDQGTLRTVGRASVVDFVGDSGSRLRQAGEQVDGLVQAGASMMRGLLGSTNSGQQTQRPRDLMVAVLAEVKAVLASRPGADTLRGVASNLVNAAAKTLGAGSRGSEAEARLQWASEGERSLRESLLLFFVSLFYELPEFVTVDRNDKRGGGHQVDHRGFLSRRQASGDSRELLELLSKFRESQMFERFCSQQLDGQQQQQQHLSSLDSDSSSSSPDEPYGAVCLELRKRRLGPTVSNVKGAIEVMRRGGVVVRGGPGDLHGPTLQYTDGRADGAEMNRLVEKVVEDASNAALLPSIFRALDTKLEASAAAGARGQAGQAAMRAMTLLRTLLVHGPQACLSAGIDLIPALRIIIRGDQRQNRRGSVSSAVQQATLALSGIQQAIGGSLSGGAENGRIQEGEVVRESAQATVLLLLDHLRLQHQRKYAALARAGAFPYLRLPMQRIKAAPLTGFASLHSLLRPPSLAASPPASVALKLGSPTHTDSASSSSASVFTPTVPAAKTVVPPAAWITSPPQPLTSQSSSYSSLPPAPTSTLTKPAAAVAHSLSAPAPPAPIPPLPVPVAAPAAVPIATYRQRMEAIYAVHMPLKVADVPALLERYAGQEENVLAKLEGRFGRVPVVVGGMTLAIPGDDGGGGVTTDLLSMSPRSPNPSNPFATTLSSNQNQSGVFSGPPPNLTPQAPPVVFRGDIPPEFRVVNKDTGVVQDLRLLLGQSGPSTTTTMMRPGYSNVPEQFRVVNKDTGEVTDIRQLGSAMGGGGGDRGGQMPQAWRPGMPIPSPSMNASAPRDPFASLGVMRK